MLLIIHIFTTHSTHRKLYEAENGVEKEKTFSNSQVFSFEN